MSYAAEHERHEQDPGAYLLGALDDGEKAAFERHLAGCATCRDAVDELSVAAEALPRGVEPFEAPESLKRSLMEVVEQEAAAAGGAQPKLRRRRPKLGRLLGGLRPQMALAGAAVLLAVGVAIGYGAFGTGGDDGPRTVTAQVDRSRLQDGSARLTIPDGDAEGAVLNVTGLPQPTGERIYMLWMVRDGKVEPAGSYFAVGADGTGAAAIPDDLDGVDAIYVTREAEGGVPRPTEAPVITVRV